MVCRTGARQQGASVLISMLTIPTCDETPCDWKRHGSPTRWPYRVVVASNHRGKLPPESRIRQTPGGLRVGQPSSRPGRD